MQAEDDRYISGLINMTVVWIKVQMPSDRFLP
jgi:hypothetical protein